MYMFKDHLFTQQNHKNDTVLTAALSKLILWYKIWEVKETHFALEGYLHSLSQCQAQSVMPPVRICFYVHLLLLP